MGAWYGNYLSATTTFYRADKPQASYGEFASNARGPGRLAHSYASNMNDAGVYIGACQRVCHSVVTDSHFQYNALGYSGTNAGGPLVLKDSEWDHNASGIVTNSQNNDDAPSPQDGACPNGGTGPTGHLLLHAHRPQLRPRQQQQQDPADDAIPVWDGHRGLRRAQRHRGGQQGHPPWSLGDPRPHLPRLRSAAADRPLPGGIPDAFGPGSCVYNDFGNQTFNNVLSQNGFYGNPTNGDLAELSARGANGKEQLLVRQQAPGRKRSHHRPLESADPPRQGAVRAAPNRGEQRRARSGRRAATRGCSPAIPACTTRLTGGSSSTSCRPSRRCRTPAPACPPTRGVRAARAGRRRH